MYTVTITWETTPISRDLRRNPVLELLVRKRAETLCFLSCLGFLTSTRGVGLDLCFAGLDLRSPRELRWKKNPRTVCSCLRHNWNEGSDGFCCLRKDSGVLSLQLYNAENTIHFKF